MDRTYRLALLLVTLALLPLMGSCGVTGDTTLVEGGVPGNGGNGGGEECADPSYENLTGPWIVSETLTSEDCQISEGLSSFTVALVQSGSQLLFTGDAVFTAELCGGRASTRHHFSYARDSGVHTVTTFLITFQTDTTATGSTTWTWTDGSESCTGTSTFTAVK